jgi:hypothetical protein
MTTTSNIYARDGKLVFRAYLEDSARRAELDRGCAGLGAQLLGDLAALRRVVMVRRRGIAIMMMMMMMMMITMMVMMMIGASMLVLLIKFTRGVGEE